ncbi:kinase-like domain-containing protein [Jimgerdemannia flammicorona]|uniref:Kinase-like domain-containing protein n=2 Tax=Jimgerdemannia flammicorona TaxID=994334 RepID=A0A433P7S3_9FUNG|nr:kinase-like domain-containing protein [Jimgerdemannia flammicorona]RUS13578.1 kinase-like domain-containing protein [Jimgerdemannia flammicorona]
MARKASPYDEYDVLDEIGDGSFGSVHHAKHKKTGHVVAIKKMKRKFHSLSECTNLREYKALRLLSAHANIVQLHECFLSPAPAKEFYFVMEYMDGGNLYQLMKERRAHGGLERGEVRRIW